MPGAPAAFRSKFEDSAMKIIHKVFSLLSSRERLQVYGLSVAILFRAIMQVLGIASIAPFLALVANPDAINDNVFLNRLYHMFNFADETSFLVFVGTLVLAVFTFNNLFSMLTTWMMTRFSWMRNYSLSRRLLEHYLHMPYVFFLSRNSSELAKNVLAEVKEVISGVLIPALKLVAQTIAVLAIIALLMLVNPYLAVTSLVVLGGSYAAVYALVRRKLTRIGSERLAANRDQYKFASEAFAGIKDIKLLGKENVFLRRYTASSRRYARLKTTKEIIGIVPHYLIETLALGGILLMVIYMLISQGNLAQALPTIGVFVFASYRLLPALREIFKDVTLIRFNMAALDEVHRDLQRQRQQDSLQRDKVPALPFRDTLALQDVVFQYPEAQEPVLKNFSLTVKANTSVALVGTTGSGKTTTVDIILGLLRPDKGRLIVDGTPVTEENLPNWQKNLGYVPQHIYLSDDSIMHNIAFGVPRKQIDIQAVEQAAKIANIHDFITSELPEGYHTLVGERGVRLSGGQRQRIGIARALYHNPDVLILDEATSALDGVTEENVFRAVDNIARTKTVIMIAHRMSTIRNCDVIYLLEKGRIIAHGSYDDLLEKSSTFRSMAGASLQPLRGT
jgi:ABC-type multidrug transport system fused ATPase/permease subunit